MPFHGSSCASRATSAAAELLVINFIETRVNIILNSLLVVETYRNTSRLQQNKILETVNKLEITERKRIRMTSNRHHVDCEAQLA